MENYIVIYAIVPKHIYETKLLTPEEQAEMQRLIDEIVGKDGDLDE